MSHPFTANGSVRPSIDRLERNKAGLNSPIFDSNTDMASAAEKPKSPKQDRTSPSSPRKQEGSPTQNSIRVIKKDEEEGVNFKVNLTGPTEDGTGAELSVSLGSATEKKSDARSPTGEKGEVQLTPTKVKTQKEKTKPADTKSDAKAASGKKSGDESDKSDDSDDGKSECMPMTQEEIDNIMKKYWKMSDKARTMYLDFFFSVDEYRYGYFTIQQMYNKLSQMRVRMTTKEFAKMFVDLDKDNDKLVSLEEYMDEMSRKNMANLSTEELREWFTRFDKDKDGVISKQDLKQVFSDSSTGVTKPDYAKIFHYDSSGKHKSLNFDDFCRYLKNEWQHEASD